MDSEIDRLNKGFEKEKLTNPDITFGEYYVSSVLKKIDAEGTHTTLGANVTNEEDWYEAGRKSFSQMCGMAGLDQRKAVVDYGCGSLRLGKHFIDFLNPGKYMGLDVTDDFIRIGLGLMDDAVLAEKHPMFGVIDNDDDIEQARTLSPGLLIAHGVHFHVHPDELPRFYRNMERIAHVPGSVLIFNTNISDNFFQYGPRDWAWPLEEIKKNLPDFELKNMHKRGGNKDMTSYYLHFIRT